jgi:hypothetical protein
MEQYKYLKYKSKYNNLKSGQSGGGGGGYISYSIQPKLHYNNWDDTSNMSLVLMSDFLIKKGIDIDILEKKLNIESLKIEFQSQIKGSFPNNDQRKQILREIDGLFYVHSYNNDFYNFNRIHWQKLNEIENQQSLASTSSTTARQATTIPATSSTTTIPATSSTTAIPATTIPATTSPPMLSDRRKTEIWEEIKYLVEEITSQTTKAEIKSYLSQITNNLEELEYAVFRYNKYLDFKISDLLRTKTLQMDNPKIQNMKNLIITESNKFEFELYNITFKKI